MINKSKFIVFEGIDGAGKTTQINLLAAALSKHNIACSVTAEPTTLPSGKLLRQALAGEIPTTAMEMAEMFARDRVNHNVDKEQGIEKQLSDGITVISDRYYYSSLAYQGAELGFDAVSALNLENPDIRTPDLCVFLDLTPEKSLERIGARVDVPREIYENYEYLEKTRKMFFDVFERLKQRGEKIVIIDASGSVDDIAARIFDAVIQIF
ncbi:MAG: dTMP kinase [Ruminococcaceae bacterium]|nr:dTMP kinase [Oscillospiraceae bacterium]